MPTRCNLCGDEIDPDQSHCGRKGCPFPDETEPTWESPPTLPGHEDPKDKPKEEHPKFPHSEKEGKNLDRGYTWKDLKMK